MSTITICSGVRSRALLSKPNCSTQALTGPVENNQKERAKKARFIHQKQKSFLCLEISTDIKRYSVYEVKRNKPHFQRACTYFTL